MKGKVCLVTGASSGIGRATAIALSEIGAVVVLVCRDEARGRAARARVVTEGGNGSAELMTADLSSPASVRALAAEFGAKYPRLDLLVNDAAVFLSKRRLTPDGLELMFATNYLCPFLLTRLLLPKLEAARPSRVINVSAPSSIMPDFDDLQGERAFGAIGAFGASKAAELLFTYALARRLEGRGVTVNAYHPGIVRTKLVRGAPAAVRAITSVLNVFMGVSPKRASRGLVHLASSAEFESTTGALIHDGKAMRAPFSGDIEAQDRLWRLSCGLTGLPEDV
ncbi:MAG TPA: SDR family NAD(P)-dependent oxidoreductase [Nitrososphaerales archaeon]|nr:SDR family NAD(P)-dependent oxidoreductase [Nitrososphaerales archaeon]